jgi:hypothetical protein
MKIFFAGADGLMFRDILYTNGVRNILMSYYAARDKADFSDVDKFESIFLDSGGFTARSRGIDIDVVKYGEFIKRNPRFKIYANLDLMETEKTLTNQKTLEDMNLKPIPVFHYDEWRNGKGYLLDEYIKKSPYIALGGIAGSAVSKKILEAYLDFCFYKIPRTTKVHGFGITSMWALQRYPFYSVDSTAWLSGGKFGRITKKTGLLNTSIQANNNDKYPLNRVLTYQEMFVNNIATYLQLQKDITELWKNRGIDWTK